jgi:hypothetical protein
MKTEPNFNHESQDTLEACGLTEEGLQETLSNFRDLIDTHGKVVDGYIPKLSEITAMVESVMTKRELSFFYAQHMMMEFERYEAKEMLKEGLKGFLNPESEDGV